MALSPTDRPHSGGVNCVEYQETTQYKAVSPTTPLPVYHPLNSATNPLYVTGTDLAFFVDGAAGNDTTGTGTAAAPWKTIQKAVNTVPAGSRVNILPGVYRETGSGAQSGDGLWLTKDIELATQRGFGGTEWGGTKADDDFTNTYVDIRASVAVTNASWALDVIGTEHTSTGFTYSTFYKTKTLRPGALYLPNDQIRGGVTDSNRQWMQYQWVDDFRALRLTPGAYTWFGAISNKGAWTTSTAYTANASARTSDVVSNGGNYYRCLVAHTAGAATEPGVGASWETVWDVATTWLPGATTIAISAFPVSAINEGQFAALADYTAGDWVFHHGAYWYAYADSGASTSVVEPGVTTGWETTWAPGRVGLPGDITYKGTWSAGSFSINEVVFYNGVFYQATGTTSATPPGTGWTASVFALESAEKNSCVNILTGCSRARFDGIVFTGADGWGVLCQQKVAAATAVDMRQYVFTNCKCRYIWNDQNGIGDGFTLQGEFEADFWHCEAYRCYTDGFNNKYGGTARYVDCASYHNGDNGYSPHSGSAMRLESCYAYGNLGGNSAAQIAAVYGGSVVMADCVVRGIGKGDDKGVLVSDTHSTVNVQRGCITNCGYGVYGMNYGRIAVYQTDFDTTVPAETNVTASYYNDGTAFVTMIGY
jgi:hypothetical protein